MYLQNTTYTASFYLVKITAYTYYKSLVPKIQKMASKFTPIQLYIRCTELNLK